MKIAESGANPAAIQILPGNEYLDTTTLYVHASDKYAEKSHKKFHPLAQATEDGISLIILCQVTFKDLSRKLLC